jgi:hypothetical protein
MEFIIDLWVSIPDYYQTNIILIISLAVPATIVIFVRHKWIGIILGMLFFAIPSELNYYVLCSRKLRFCSAEDYEIDPIIMSVFISFLYCLFVKFLYFSIRTLFKE